MFLKAGICHLAAGDTVAAKRGLDQYGSISFEWNDSRESKFLNLLVDASNSYDEDAFSKAVQEYDNLSRIDQWKTTVLLKAKENIKTDEENIL